MLANTRKKYYLEKANTKLYKIQQVRITFNKIVYTLSVFENLIGSGKTSRYLFLPFMLMNLNVIF